MISKLQMDSELSRRRMLTSLAVAGTVAVTNGAFAQQAGGSAGAQASKVWLDLDQKQLDDAYDQSKYAPNLQQIIKRYASNSDETRKRIGAPKRVAYGSTPIEQLDIYAARRPNAPINVYIHGGAWRSGLAKDYAFPAEMFNTAGAHYVVLDFINVIEAQGSLMLWPNRSAAGSPGCIKMPRALVAIPAESSFLDSRPEPTWAVWF